MKIYEEKLVSTFEKTLVKTVCNICGKGIGENDNYYEVTKGHHDWGNDSIESVSELDICSDECLQKEFKTYLESSYDTKYIDVTKQ